MMKCLSTELFNELAGLTILIDEKGFIVKVNKQVKELLNYTDREIISKASEIFIENNEIKEILKNCHLIKEPLRFEDVNLLSKSGIKIPFHIYITPLYDPESQCFLGVLLIGQDISATKLQDEILKHKVTYANLRNSEDLFRTILDIVPFSIILTNVKDHKVLYVNNQTELFLKVDKNQIIGTNATLYYKDPNDRYLLLDDIAQNHPIKDREIVYVRKDGSEVIGLITMVPTIYKSQNALLSCISDVTEQRKLQQEVVKSEKMLKELMYSIPDVVVVTDLNGTITFVNNSTYTIFDYEPDKLFVSESILIFIAKEDIPRARKNIKKRLVDNPGPVDYIAIKKDGTIFHVEINGTLLYNDQSMPSEIIYVIRDVTERKKVEAQLRKNNEKIELMNKELLYKNDLLKNQSVRDSLTNLYNHQYINDLLETVIAKNSSTEANLCVMMLDIDFFKRVNDTYGHQFGDKVLVEVSNLIIKNTRNTDFIGRYGGEEFIVILPEVNLDTAYQIAERIRIGIQNYNFGQDDYKITISIGLAKYNSEDAKSLVNRADNLLYQAKHNGRNRTEK